MQNSAKFALLACLALGACTVGPDYAGPPESIPAMNPATGRAPGFVRGGGAPVTAEAPPLAAWWETLGDPVLSGIERQALAASPDLAAAEARLRRAQAALRIERADQMPSIAGSSTAAYARIPALGLGGSDNSSSSGNSGNGSKSGPSEVDFYNTAFLASWEVDLFGGGRRQVEASRASLEAAEASIADAQVSLTAAVAQAYISWREIQQRIAYARAANATQSQALELMRQRFAAGTTSQVEVEQLATQLENADAQVLPLQAEAEGYANALAVLAGQAPGALDALLAQAGAIPMPPASVPIGDPAALIKRRPDIRAAERRLAEQTARIGVAEAARFPRLNFLGILGIGGTDPGAVVDPDNLIALAAPMLQWSFLDFGRGKAQVGEAEAMRDEAEAQYRSAVLGALQDAEDALSRFAHRRDTIAGLALAETSTARTAELIGQRYSAGTTTRIAVLDAERAHIAAEQSLATARAGLTADYVTLQKALGLGWAAPGQALASAR